MAPGKKREKHGQSKNGKYQPNKMMKLDKSPETSRRSTRSSLNTSCDKLESPFKEFTNLASLPSTSRISGRKKSLRKISVDNSPVIPLNDDCNELNEEDKEQIEVDEKSLDKSTKPEEEPEMSIVQKMTMEQMQEHVSRCLQLSTENKITTKNAFALKLIDCMTIISKSDNENNFAAMACQLDAGAKIYSSRVDAVHQQVMKLVETCSLAHKRSNKNNEETGDQDDNSDYEENEGGERGKGKKKKGKKKVIAAQEQISHKPKESDPRDKFMRLQALPGDILEKARRNQADLSLTLDNDTQFWVNWNIYTATKASGNCELSHQRYKSAIKKHKLGPTLNVDTKIDMSTIPKLGPLLPLASCDGDSDWCDDMAVADNEECDDIENKTKAETIDDVEMVTIARERMAFSSCRKPTRLDVIKALFHQPGESDYHYLKMDNSYYWAGPSYWKRPHGINIAENKRKVVRKKKEPLEILYNPTTLNKSLKQNKSASGVVFKRSTVLSKRTIARWSKKRVTYPADIGFRPQTFHLLFHFEIAAQMVMHDTVAGNCTISDIEMEGEDDNIFLEDIPGHESNNEEEEAPATAMTDSQNKNDGGEQKEMSAEKPAQIKEESLAIPSTSSEPIAGSSSGSCDVYEGDNLVPMVKRVVVEPIKYSTKPNRVDMHHLKDIMLAIILRGIEDQENQLRSEGVSSPEGSVEFRNVLFKLFNSDDLHHRTREDLTVGMAFLALLTLANEHNLDLIRQDENNIEDVKISLLKIKVKS